MAQGNSSDKGQVKQTHRTQNNIKITKTLFAKKIIKANEQIRFPKRQSVPVE